MSGRFLIIQTAFIGDAILATALLETLHRAYPHAQLDLLVRRGNESLFVGHPFLNRVLVWEKKTAKYRSLWQLLGQVRSARYDVVLNLQRFGATGLLTAFSGAKTTIGFTKNPFSWAFTHRVQHQVGQPNATGTGPHEVDRNNALLAPLNVPDTAPPRPRLYPAPADYLFVKNWQSDAYVCVAPASVWFTKQYPVSGWVAVIDALPGHLRVYLLGAPADAAVCEAVRDGVGRARVVSLAGQLTLLQSAALMQGATMNYVNDSAPLHLCSAMNAPTTAVFCSTIPAFGFGPLATQSRVAQTREALLCRPCNLHGKPACPLGHFRCAHGIDVADVVDTTLV